VNISKTKILFTIFILTVSAYISFVYDYLLAINKAYINVVLDGILLIIGISSFKISSTKIKLPLFFIFLIAFIIFVYFNNRDQANLLLTLNGIREFIPFFVIPILYMHCFQSNKAEYFVKLYDRFLLIFLVVQIPVSLFQFSRFGAGDAVGGTLGEGYSGVLTFTIYLSTYYLMIKNYDSHNIMKSLLKKWYLFLFWIPTFVNETKISFILIPIFILLLFELRFKNIFNRKLIFIILLIMAGGYLFSYVYSRTSGESISDIFTEDYLTGYLVGDITKDNIHIGDDIPRIMKLSLSFLVFNEEKLLTGNGIGHFKGGTELRLTPFADQYYWLLLGSRPMLFFLLIQIGIIGVLMVYYYWFKISRFVWINGKIRMTKNIIIICTLCFAIIQLYNDSLRSLFYCGIFMYILIYPIYNNKNET
jgi:hypothetical protein